MEPNVIRALCDTANVVLPQCHPQSFCWRWVCSTATSMQAINHPGGSSWGLRSPASLHCPSAPSTSYSVSHSALGARRSGSGHSKRHRTCLISSAKGDDGNGGRKADFSAYWSMKVRQWFSPRRQYLEDANRPSFEAREPEIFKRMDEFLEKQRQELEQLQAATIEQHENAAEQKLQQQLAAKGGDVSKVITPEQQAQAEIAATQNYLQSFAVKGVALGLFRANRFLKQLALLPFTMLATLYSAWRANFTTQRYEMFLMSEGERIWYWRNRTENERWFWEVFAWDRLVFPILATVAYEYIVPNNLLWAVVVPAVFLTWQTGSVPGPLNLEFWLIGWFGLYKKCWPNVMSAWLAVTGLA